MSTIVILGAGMMGSALSVPLFDAGHEVRLVGTHLDRDVVDALKRDGVHPKLRQKLPAGVQPFFVEELADAMTSADALALGVSSAGVRWAAQTIAPFVSSARPVLMVSKGLDWDGSRLSLLPDVLAELLPAGAGVHPVAVAGPCIAGELARRVETCVVFAGRDARSTGDLARLARTPYYHVRTTDDLMGAELCAALKNAYAMGIAFGIGLHERRGGSPGSVALHNYESAVFAQSLMEMRRLVVALGGAADTVLGLAGAGDLDVTCNGGRTGRFGRLLGLGLSLEVATAQMEGATLECLDILRVFQSALPNLPTSYGIERAELPLLDHLIEVALEGQEVRIPFERFFGG